MVTPSGLPTYRDLIRDTVKVQGALSKEYQKYADFLLFFLFTVPVHYSACVK